MREDVRMRGFRTRTDLDEVLKLLENRIAPTPAESVPMLDALGRVLAGTVRAPMNVPPFARSAMDGYAVRATDLTGASEGSPIPLTVVGDVTPGAPPPRGIGPGEAIRVMTGGPIPPGADAVLVAEYAEREGDRVWARAAVSPGRHVGLAGEDLREGELVFPAGRRLLPADLGVLTSLGFARVDVHRSPTLDLIVTGDEIRTPPDPLGPYQIYDSNRPTILAMAILYGADARFKGIFPDDHDAIRDAMSSSKADIVVTTGGASVGRLDFAAVILNEIGDLAVHGIAIRPAAPTGVGFLGARPVFVLPGNPVAAAVAMDAVVGPAIQLMSGRRPSRPYPVVRAPLARKIAKQPGSVEYVRVRFLEDGRVEPLRTGGAGILSSLARADGLVVVDKLAEGHAENEMVEVRLLAFGPR